MPPPVPPMVKDGRMIHGRPITSIASIASAIVFATRERGVSKPILSMAFLNRSLSSALSMTSALAPIISTFKASSMPRFFNSSAVLSAVWPPMVGKIASGRSSAMILATTSGVIGSMYVASANSGSVMIVAGFELTKMTR